MNNINNKDGAAVFLTMAPEHWIVRKVKTVHDGELAKIHQLELAKLKCYCNSSNKKAVEIIKSIFLKLRWASPEWPASIQQLIVECSHHYLGETPFATFPKQNLLNIWYQRAQGTECEKVSLEVQRDFELLKSVLEGRDHRISSSIGGLEKRTQEMTLRSEGKLRWMMETKAVSCASLPLNEFLLAFSPLYHS
jgi:hypothetical protein